jgi:energy-coupling factor transporter ATP-binding protein EcfA2
MEKQIKKSRKAKVFYTLQNAAGKDVSIDLNNYKIVCNKTGKSKSFYHKYLAGLIQRKYGNNIDRFRTEYVSREAAPDKNQRRVNQLVERIQKLSVQLSNLKGELAEAESGVEHFPAA